MIIVGAGNLGKTIIESLVFEKHELLSTQILFFDENSSEKQVFNKFQIINNINDLQEYIYTTSDNKYFCAIGNARIRQKTDVLMKSIGLDPISIISNHSSISQFAFVSEHALWFYNTICLFSSKIGYSNIVHPFASISHCVEIGNYVNISAKATILPDCKIGDFTFIGTNAVIMPGITIGKYCYINAGSIIKSDMKDYETR